MTYRNDVEALEARHAALTAEVEAKTRELDDASRILDEARTRARLPILDNIRVASPCPVEWKDMTGDERVRACAKCEKHVYNLSQMTRDEAEALIIEREGNLCVRYFQRNDGTIMLADCTVGRARKSTRRLIAAGAMTMLASAGIGAAVHSRQKHCEKLGEIKIETHEAVTGLVSIEPPPPPTEELHDIRGQMVVTPQATVGKMKLKLSKPSRHDK